MTISSLVFILLLLLSSTAGASKSTAPNNKKPKPCCGDASSSSFSNNRRACNFYIWDVRSALLYRWCHHLLKDHIYEGRGGVRFVRYESNSILQLLYPCSRYAPNKCLVCGGNYADHLELRWSSHLYKPFDLHIDKTYREGLLIGGRPMEGSSSTKKNNNKSYKRSTSSSSSGNRRSGRNKHRTSTPKVLKRPPSFGFHRRYVYDVSDMVFNSSEKEFNRVKERVKEKFLKMNELRGVEQLRLTRFPEYKVAYLTPQITTTSNKTGREGRRRSSFVLKLGRFLCLNQLHNLVAMQESENKRLQE